MKNFATTFSKIFLLYAVIFVLSDSSAFAQITISADQFTQAFIQSASSITYRDTSAKGLQPLITQSGANQTWDFSGFPFMIDTSGVSPSHIVAYSSSIPEADSFPGATHVQVTVNSDGSSSYDFYEINQTGFYGMGSSQTDNTGKASVTAKVSPPEELAAFPLQYQQSWTTTSAVSGGGFTGTEKVEGLVDSWGTFILPGNISESALRLRQKTTNLSAFYNDTSYSFVWFSLSGYSVTINSDVNQNVRDASYDAPGAPNIVLNNSSSQDYSMNVGANPVNSPTNVSFTTPSESAVRISLMDPLGRESQVLMNGMAHPGINTLQFNPSNIVNGTYFLRIESAGYSNVQKMIVAN